MMHGMVTINDEPTKSRIYRFCEKKIDQWVRDHQDEVVGSEMTNAKSIDASGTGVTSQIATDKKSTAADAPFGDEEIVFTVSFTEQDTHQVACTTEVQCRGRAFRGWDLAQDTQNAFMHSLRRLQKAIQVNAFR